MHDAHFNIFSFEDSTQKKVKIKVLLYKLTY